MERKVFLCQSFLWVMILLGQIHGYKSCIVKERKALLELNTIFTGSFDDTKSDCCSWVGVECNRTTGRVIMLSLNGFSAKNNSLLNLSLLHPFEDLQSLDLSNAGFIGLFDDVEGYRSLRILRNLEILDLSDNMFNNSIFPFLNAATSLTTLFLQRNIMSGPFSVKGLFALRILDLSGNEFSDSMGLQVFCEMKKLQELDLSRNNLVGQLPSCLGSLNKLRVLELSSNKISGVLPSSFSGLESLEYLSLLRNNFTGLFSLNPLGHLTKLKVFQLSSRNDMIRVEIESNWQPKFQLSVVELPFCSLEKIPDFLIYQKNLSLIDLSGNRLSGHIPTWLLEYNPELKVLELQNNSFNIFRMPTTLVHKLKVLDISANDISGVLPENIGHALPNLLHLNGSDNRFQGNLPSSMGEMKNISYLELSYNNFTGEVPRSFVMGCFSLKYLKLSHNKLGGDFLTRPTNLTSLLSLEINNNLITGKIGAGLRSSVALLEVDMSNNRLTGAIPSGISNFSALGSLMLSNNFLEGAIPPSLLLIEYFSILDLSGNKLSGALPSHVNGEYLFLDNNNFMGPIPKTFLENVTVLDLRNNKLSGSIPKFVSAQDIKILLLRGNNLTESIPTQLCDLSSIIILDLSDNKLNGSIPSCLNNLSFGFGEGKMTYISGTSSRALRFYKSTLVSALFDLSYGVSRVEFDINFAMKQRYDSYHGPSEFSEGTVDFLYGLDLSRNELSGAIPTELGDLSKLKALNLSHNFLSSSIPDSFSRLNDIESLDLSFNMLHGGIPHELTNLTSLSSFNVSYNNLSGIIPQGRQFNTFNENNYLGNPLLCGPLMNRSCEAKKNAEESDNEGGTEEEDDEAGIDMLVFYWSTASTYVIALIGSLVLMSFDCPWRRALLRLKDSFIIAAKSVLS